MKQEEVKELLGKINTTACGGPIGVNNETLGWIIDKNDKYKFVEAVYRVCKVIVQKGIYGPIRDVMAFAKGLSLGKEDANGVKDADIRPIVIMDSVIRILDRVITANVDEETMKKAIG